MGKRIIIKKYKHGRKNAMYYDMQCINCSKLFAVLASNYKNRNKGHYCCIGCCNEDKINKKKPKHSRFMKEYNPMRSKEIRKKHLKAIRRPEAIKKKVEAMKAYYKKHPEGRKIRSEKSRKFLKENPEKHPMKQEGVKERHKEIMKNFYKLHPEIRKKQGETLKEFYKKYPEKHPNRILAQKGHKTDIERIMQDLLELLGLKEKKDFEYNFPVKNYFVDFALFGKKIAIECDGEYWHKDKVKDLRRQKEIEKEGWKVIRFNDKEIKNHAEKCMQCICKVM